MTHFNKRCVERGISGDLDGIYKALLHAISLGGTDDVEYVLTKGESRFWRFRVPEGVFYAVTALDNPCPQTVYTHEMVKSLKDSRRKISKKRKKGRRARQGK